MTAVRLPAGALRWVVAALAALLAAWVLAPGAVPLYDGPSQPDEPYRYVQPPPNYRSTPKPTVARVTVPVHNGVSSPQYGNSAEQGPQISVYVPAGSLGPPPGATSLVLQAVPAAPSPPLPTDGRIVSNVYRISATDPSGRQATVIGTGHNVPTIQMRAPTAKQPGPVFEHRTANGWRQSQTIRIGQDIYQTSAPALGDWALVQLTSAPATASGGSHVSIGLLVLGLAVLALAGLILGIRLRRTRVVAP